MQIVENKNIMGIALKEANFSLAGVYYAAGEVPLFVTPTIQPMADEIIAASLRPAPPESSL